MQAGISPEFASFSYNKAQVKMRSESEQNKKVNEHTDSQETLLAPPGFTVSSKDSQQYSEGFAAMQYLLPVSQV